MAKPKRTKEGQAAQKIADAVNDLYLDLDLTGIYLADLSSSVIYNRVQEVVDSARERKEYVYTEEEHYNLLRELD